jgi:hypothetical protein
MPRKLPRVLLNVLTALSLLLCVAACALWARSYSYYDTAGFTRLDNGRGWFGAAYSLNGRMMFLWEPDRPVDKGRFWAQERLSDDRLPGMKDVDYTAACQHRFLGFGLRKHVSPFLLAGQSRPGVMHMVVWPHWAAAALFAVAPLTRAARWRRRRRRRRRRRAGLCPACAYDLRGIVGRCPECGVAIAAVAEGGRL